MEGLARRTVGLALCVILSSLAGTYAQRPVITSPPSSGYAAKDEANTLSCAYDSSSPATVSWYKDGEKILNQYDNPDSKYYLLDSGDLFFLKFTTRDAGSYFCNVTNEHGSTISSNVTIQISVLREEFRVIPQSTSAVLGSSVTLRCQPPRGVPEPQVRWKRNGTLLDVYGDPRLTVEYPPGNLVIRSIRRSDNTSYVCVGINEAGQQNSEAAVLTVLEAPTIVASPIDTIAHEGSDATFRCEAVGDPSPNITWVKNDDKLVSARTVVRADSLVIRNVDASDEGAYTCIAHNVGGTSTASGHLTVFTRPRFLQRPISKTVGKGSNVTFRCVVSGNPVPTTLWSTDQDDSLVLYARQKRGRFSVLQDGSLKVTDSQPDDTGVYKCFASNEAGTDISSASLRVRESNTRPPPIITESPQNVTVALNQVVELQCKASGLPSPTIRWRHNARPVLDDSRISINRGNLKITDVRVTDGGEYTCLAISESGEASASALLNVLGVVNNVVETLLPPAPERPTAMAQEVLETSVKLYWGASGGHVHGVTYRVETFTLDNKEGWKVAVSDIGETWALVENLLPGTPYLMLVRAFNSYGSSEASPLSDYIRTEGVAPSSLSSWTDDEMKANVNSTNVRILSVDVLGSTAINVTWRIQSQSRAYVAGFHVRVYMPGSSGGASVPAAEIYGSLSTYHIITNLEPYTQYAVTVTPFYHHFSGRPSSLLTAVTQQDVPSGPPTNVQVKEGPRYITVSWGLPKPSHRNGEIVGYVIVCQAADERLSKNFSVNATVTNVALDNLRRDTVYRIGVVARTKVGPGVISHLSPLDAKTSPDKKDATWWQHTLIGAIGGFIWVVLCILIICLCRRRRAHRIAKKQLAGNIVTVPLQTTSAAQGLFVQYEVDQGANIAMSQTPAHQIADGNNPLNFHLGYSEQMSNFNGGDYGDQHNMDNYNEAQFKTFYNKSDSMSTGPYATTVILNNMPERDENLIPKESPHATLTAAGNIVHGSESSCTDNNAGRPGAISNSSGERASPPVLPSFADMLPPPPLYPPPPSGSAGDKTPLDYSRAGQTGPVLLGTLPKLAPAQCHTCQRSYHHNGSNTAGLDPRPRAHFVLDSQGRLYNPTMPHMHSLANTSYNNSLSNNEYHTTYPSLPRAECKHAYQPYNVCTPHGHSSDSHDYAEPQFDCTEQNIYGGIPPFLQHPHLQQQQQQHRLPPHLLQHQIHQQQQQQHLSEPSARSPLAHQNSMPAHIHPISAPPAAGSRHHSLPSSEHSHELCLSCAEQTEYEEPWSDQHWQLMYDPNHAAAQLHLQQRQHYQQQMQGVDDGEVEGDGEVDDFEEGAEDTPMLTAEQASVASSAEQSQGSHTGQSRSGSEDSKSGRQRQRRRQRAQQQPARPTSPYNGYSTDSSVVFVPRKPYPKSQRKKQMNSKPKSTKSLAVQVEQDEIHQDKV